MKNIKIESNISKTKVRMGFFHTLSILFATTIVFTITLTCRSSDTAGSDTAGSDAAKGNGTKTQNEGSYSVAFVSVEDAKSYLKDIRGFKKVHLDVRNLQNVHGSKDAYIIIHKFIDFRCPHCRTASKTVQLAMRRWPGRIRVYYRHFPLDGSCNSLINRKPMGAWSCRGALASICSTEQNLFPALAYKIFDLQEKNAAISQKTLRRIVRGMGGDWKQMHRCMKSDKTQAVLERDLSDALKIKIRATPTFVIENHVLPAGAPEQEFFLHLIDAFVFEKEGRNADRERHGVQKTVKKIMENKI